MDFHKQWKEQCEAAGGIQERYGTDKALGYLIGEKLLNHMQAAEGNELFEGEITLFCSEIKKMFEPWEIEFYLDNIERTGASGHLMTDDEYKEVGHKMFEFDVVDSAENILRIEKIKSLLINDD